MSPSPRRGHYANFAYCNLTKVVSAPSFHTDNIYIYIIPHETQRNQPKPLFPNFFATKPTQAQNELLRCRIFAS